MRAALLPVKDPCRAKQRLVGFLDEKERFELVWAMLRDVAQALCGAWRADRIVVVTRDPGVRMFAASLGWDCLAESEQVSESASVDWASAELKRRGVTAVLRLPGDVPLVTSSDIDALLSVELTLPAAVIVPSRGGRGTNALLRTPPDAFPSRFGPNSFRLHEQEAGRAGVSLVKVSNERLALDIDEPRDLARFLRKRSAGATAEFLRSLDLEARFERVSA
jgi:2-phospho-L-lactate guanylyltransferase